jgi:hypothetical protein
MWIVAKAKSKTSLILITGHLLFLAGCAAHAASTPKSSKTITSKTTSSSTSTKKIPRVITKQVPISEVDGPGCDAPSVQHAVGKIATAELARTLMKQSGASILRWIPPRTAVTMDYSASRLNIQYDDNYVIETISCG